MPPATKGAPKLDIREATWFSDGKDKHFTLAPRPTGLEWTPTELPLTVASAREVRVWDEGTKSVKTTFNKVETMSDDIVDSTKSQKSSSIDDVKVSSKTIPIGKVSSKVRSVTTMASSPMTTTNAVDAPGDAVLASTTLKSDDCEMIRMVRQPSKTHLDVTVGPRIFRVPIDHKSEHNLLSVTAYNVMLNEIRSRRVDKTDQTLRNLSTIIDEIENKSTEVKNAEGETVAASKPVRVFIRVDGVLTNLWIQVVSDSSTNVPVVLKKTS